MPSLPSMPWNKTRTLDELQSENERLEVEYSVEQKKAAIRKLKALGVEKSSFGSWAAVMNFLKNH